MRPVPMYSEMRKFHKKYALPSSQKPIFRGLARGYPPLNAYIITTEMLDGSNVMAELLGE